MKEKLKYRTLVADHEVKAINEVGNKYLKRFSDKAIGEQFVDEILNLIYDSADQDKQIFIKDILFEYHIASKKIESNKSKIFKNLSELSNFTPKSIDETNHLISIYRSIVSDIFDPYISLLVAAIKHKESSFTDYINANLSQGERSKHEFVLSRMKPTSLFDGYSPIVRNAISHAGTDGVEVNEEEIIFRNIKRQNPPVVTVEKWSSDELQNKIIQLLNFVTAIDISVELFLIDCLDIIKSNKDLNRKFIDEILSLDQRLLLQKPFDDKIKLIINSTKVDKKEKLELLSNIFFIECEKREIDVLRIGVATEKSALMIMVPSKPVDDTKDQELYNRFVELTRYGIAAEVCYRGLFKTFVVIELEDENEACKLIVNQQSLNDYNYEKGGILDIINDSEQFFKNRPIEIKVDFEKLEELDNKNLGRIYPKKRR